MVVLQAYNLPENGAAGMKPDNIVINQILHIITLNPGCRIEHVADLLPHLTLREIVYTLHYLDRKGHLDLIVDRKGIFGVIPSLRLFS